MQKSSAKIYEGVRNRIKDIAWAEKIENGIEALTGQKFQKSGYRILTSCRKTEMKRAAWQKHMPNTQQVWGKKVVRADRRGMSLQQTQPRENYGISQIYISRSEQKVTDFRTLQYEKPSQEMIEEGKEKEGFSEHSKGQQRISMKKKHITFPPI